LLASAPEGRRFRLISAEDKLNVKKGIFFISPNIEATETDKATDIYVQNNNSLLHHLVDSKLHFT